MRRGGDFGIGVGDVAGRDVGGEGGDVLRGVRRRRRERTAVRWGASPRQKGSVGGAPWASSTRTRPAASMRWMRQLELPSWTTSPGPESTAKCFVERGDLDRLRVAG